MTVADVPARQRYAGNGVTVQFSTVFTFLANSHVRVVHTMVDGTERDLVEGGDYLLIGANTNSPGVVTTVSGVVPFGAYLTIMRNVPFTQEFNGEVLSTADAKDLELSYDKIWEGMQQLKEGLSRAFLSSPGGPGFGPTIQSWTPVLAAEDRIAFPPSPSLPVRSVLKVVDWTGGVGTKPQVGMYVGPIGFVSSHEQGVNIHGLSGPAGPGGGDMLRVNNLSDVDSKIAAIDNLSFWGTSVASAASINLDTTTSDLVMITGSSTISTITLAAGKKRLVMFDDVLILTHGASLRLPGNASLQTEKEDYALFVGHQSGSTTVCAAYIRASGKALINPDPTDLGLGTAATHPDTYFLQTTNMLQEITDKALARANLGIGTAATQDTGTAAGNVVQYATANKLPAADGSALINLPLQATGQPVPASSVYAVGTLMLMVIATGSNVANGSTISGASITVPIWAPTPDPVAGFYAVCAPSRGVGPVPAGTWMNVSGYAVGTGTSSYVGYFVRTA